MLQAGYFASTKAWHKKQKTDKTGHPYLLRLRKEGCLFSFISRTDPSPVDNPIIVSEQDHFVSQFCSHGDYKSFF